MKRLKPETRLRRQVKALETRLKAVSDDNTRISGRFYAEETARKSAESATRALESRLYDVEHRGPSSAVIAAIDSVHKAMIPDLQQLTTIAMTSSPSPSPKTADGTARVRDILGLSGSIGCAVPPTDWNPPAVRRAKVALTAVDRLLDALAHLHNAA